MTTNILNIQGLHCNACKTLIEEVAKDVAGIASCAVDLAAGTASVEADGAAAVEALMKEIEGLDGYKVTPL